MFTLTRKKKNKKVSAIPFLQVCIALIKHETKRRAAAVESKQVWFQRTFTLERQGNVSRRYSFRVRVGVVCQGSSRAAVGGSSWPMWAIRQIKSVGPVG